MAEFYNIYRATLGELGLDTQALDAHIERRGTVDSISELLTNAGFDVSDSAVQHFRMRFASGTTLLHHHFIRLGFVAGWKSLVPPAAVESFFLRLEQNLNAFAVEHGELALKVPMAYIESRKPAR
jgi:arsenite methyltransferase